MTATADIRIAIMDDETALPRKNGELVFNAPWEGRVFGISGEQMPIYYHKLKLQLDGADEAIEVEAGFVDSPGIGALLGQAGFFQHFRICFDRSKEEIEIRSSTTK